MRQHPDDVKLLLVDPKMVELSVYKDIPHLICPVVTDMKKAATILEWACMQMDSATTSSPQSTSATSRATTSSAQRHPRAPRRAPDAQIELARQAAYIIIIIDELADLMMVAAKDVETSITRLAQKSRAVGIHLILATQRPSVDVITGLIKSNLPARLSFQVSSRIDSRTILDQNGADKLLGRGDMLFLPPATAKLIRAQGTFVSDEEIRRVVEFAKGKRKPAYDEELVGWQSGSSGSASISAACPATSIPTATRSTTRPSTSSSKTSAAASASSSGGSRSDTRAPRGSSISWPRTASSAPTKARRPARSSSPRKSGKR